MNVSYKIIIILNFDPKIELYDSTREAIDKAVEKVGNDVEKFAFMYLLAMEEKDKFSARAGRVLFFVSRKHPRLVKPYIKEIVRNLPNLKSESLTRDLLRIFADVLLPEDEDDIGRLLNFCFDMMNTPTRQVSIKIYTMEILYNIVQLEPELKNELTLVIENQMRYGSAGFVSRGTRILKKLKLK